MILRPLQKIQVIESKKKCKTGSLGYFVAQDPVGNYNAWNMCIVFTRFGKKGKPRIEPLPVSLLMVDYNAMKPADRDILNITHIYEGLEPDAYMDKRGNVKYNMRETIISPVQPDGPKDLLDLPDSEFTAYIVSMSILIHKLVYNKPAHSLHLSPTNVRLRDFADEGFDLATVSPDNFGYYILSGMKLDESYQKRDIRFENDLSFGLLYARQINSARKKTQLLDRLQRSLAMAKDRLKFYDKMVLSRYDKIALRINGILEFYRHSEKELAAIKKRNKNATEEPHYKHKYSPWEAPRLKKSTLHELAEEVGIGAEVVET